MAFRTSAIYFMIIQGFGYLLGMEYTAFQLFGISSIGVALLNMWAFLDSNFDLPSILSSCCGEFGFMDEREMDLATTAAAYGLIASIFAISLNQGGIYSLGVNQIGQAGFAVFLAVFFGKTLWHKFGGR